MGRKDVVKVLQGGCSIYRIITLEESMSLPIIATETDDSILIQQQQQQQNGTTTPAVVVENWLFIMFLLLFVFHEKINLFLQKVAICFPPKRLRDLYEFCCGWPAIIDSPETRTQVNLKLAAWGLFLVFLVSVAESELKLASCLNAPKWQFLKVVNLAVVHVRFQRKKLAKLWSFPRT